MLSRPHILRIYFIFELQSTKYTNYNEQGINIWKNITNYYYFQVENKLRNYLILRMKLLLLKRKIKTSNVNKKKDYCMYKE